MKNKVLAIIVILIFVLAAIYYLWSSYSSYYHDINDPRVVSVILDEADRTLKTKSKTSKLKLSKDLEFIENDLQLSFLWKNDSVLECVEINSEVENKNLTKREEYSFLEYLLKRNVVIETFRADEEIFYDPSSEEVPPPPPPAIPKE